MGDQIRLENQHVMVIGLTGGIASGKSFVAQLLAQLGAVVLDADQHAHTVLDEPEVRRALVERWGDAVQNAQGDLQRSLIATRVFGSSAKANTERQFLEQLVHPRVREHLEADLAKAAQQGVRAVVLDIPLLYESGWAERCDQVLFVDAPEALREQRGAARGWPPGSLADREASQLPISQKRAKANHIIPGNDPEKAHAAVHAFWNTLSKNGSV